MTNICIDEGSLPRLGLIFPCTARSTPHAHCRASAALECAPESNNALPRWLDAAATATGLDDSCAARRASSYDNIAVSLDPWVQRVHPCECVGAQQARKGAQAGSQTGGSAGARAGMQADGQTDGRDVVWLGNPNLCPVEVSAMHMYTAEGLDVSCLTHV